MSPEAKINRPMILKYRRQLQSLLELTESGKLLWFKYTSGWSVEGETNFMCPQPEMTLILTTDAECEDVSLDFAVIFEDEEVELGFDPYDDDLCVKSLHELAQAVYEKARGCVEIDTSSDASVSLDSIINRLGGAA